MILHEPLKISARLLPAVQVVNAWISFERETNNFYFDLPDGQSFIVDDYRPGCFSVSNEELFVLQCFDDLFSFIEVEIEAWDYYLRASFSLALSLLMSAFALLIPPASFSTHLHRLTERSSTASLT